MLDGKAWLSVSALIHPKGVLSGWGQDSVQASQVHPHQTLSSMSLWTLLCALVHSHVGTGRVRVPFTGTKGPSPAPEKQPHTIIPLHQTLHLAQCSQTSTVLLATAKTRLVHQIARCRNTIPHSREGVSTALQSSGGVLYTTASKELLGHGNPFHEALYEHEATWSFEVYSGWLCRKLATSVHFVCQHLLTRTVILRGRPLRGWVAVIPSHFHFVTLTGDCGIFRSEEPSRLDMLHRWHPITVPRWSLSSWEWPILSQMFVETVCKPRCYFYTPVAIKVIEHLYLAI